MTLQNKTKYDIFFGTLILSCFTAVVGYFFAFAKSEGTIGNGVIANSIADYILYVFPLTFLDDLFRIKTVLLLLILVGTNALIYSFLVTRILSGWLVRLKNYKPFLVTYYSVTSVLIVVLTYFIFLISSSS